jgi:hypothetical protein
MTRKMNKCRIVVSVALAFITIILARMDQANGQSSPPTRPPGAVSGKPAPTTQPQAAPTTQPLSPLALGERRLALKIEKGHDTDSRDHGRPVALIAAALKVPEDVFRKTFSHVHPAGPGSGGPTDAEARQNKAALMAGLSPYGVTDDRINEVSNYYRYMRKNHDDLWKHREAVAFVVVNADDKVVRFDIVDAGAGYTTPPTVTIPDQRDVKITAKLLFGTDLPTNGSIESLTVAGPTTGPGK